VKRTVAKGLSTQSSMLARSSMPRSDAEGGTSPGARHRPRQWLQQADARAATDGSASPGGRRDFECEAWWRRRICVDEAHNERGSDGKSARRGCERAARVGVQRGGLLEHYRNSCIYGLV
jgi:hypothetical protein